MRGRDIRPARGLFLALAIICATLVAGAPHAARAATPSAPTVSVGDVTIAEGTGGPDRVVSVPIVLSEPATQPLTIPFTVQPGSAQTPDDYTPPKPTALTVNFTLGRTGVTGVVKLISVKVKPDASDEGDQDFTIQLSTPIAGAGYTLLHDVGTVTIHDDDNGSQPTIAVGSVSVIEGNTGSGRSFKVPLTLSEPAQQPITVQYRLVPGSAQSPSDFNDLKGAVKTVTLPLTKTGTTGVIKPIGVKIVPDNVGEANESFTVEIVSVTAGYTPDPATGTVTIVDDDTGGPNTRRLFAAGVSGAPKARARLTLTAVDTADDWASVSTGWFHTSAIKADGSLWGWGDNSFGEIGDGTTTGRLVPVRIGGDNDWAMTASSEFGSVIAVKTDGSLWAWGNNDQGQLGDGTTTDRLQPERIGTDTDWVAVATGGRTAFALKRDGSMWGWGWNGSGQIGDGSLTDRLQPVRVGLDNDWAQIAAGGFFTLALKRDGTLWSWGQDLPGEFASATPGFHTSPAQVGEDLWSSIAAGSGHALAILSDGRLFGWGQNDNGQVGVGNVMNQPYPTEIGGTGWTSISAQANSSAGLKSDGSLWTWGLNNTGRVGDGTKVTHPTPVQAGVGTVWQQVSVDQGQTLALTRPFAMEPPAPPSSDAFFTPPAPLPPAAPGNVIWASGDLSQGDDHATYTFLYHSRSVFGNDIPVSGRVFVPRVLAPNAPIVAWAHGTSGQGDACAPSRAGDSILNSYLWGLYTAGYVVVATDYEGLGVPGPATFAVPESEAHTVLDSIRAVRAMVPGVSSDAIIFGASQGGHAATAAGQYASYAPDVHLKGIVGDGPGVFREDRLLSSLANGQYRGFGLMYADGVDAAFPGRGMLDYWLTPAGVAQLPFVRSHCVGDTVNQYSSTPSTALYQPGLLTNPTTLPTPPPAIADVLDRIRLDTHTIPSTIPVLYAHGRFDDIVPPALIPPYVQYLCSGGSTVQLRWYNEGHVPVNTAYADIMNWIRDRFRDIAAPTSCGNVPNP